LEDVTFCCWFVKLRADFNYEKMTEINKKNNFGPNVNVNFSGITYNVTTQRVSQKCGFFEIEIVVGFYYSARRLMGSRIIESAAYCNQKVLAHLYINST
jgi:hypothetical protein